MESSSTAASKSYRFEYSTRCNMCGADAAQQKFFGRRLDRRQGLWPAKRAGITVPIYQCQACKLLYPNPMPIPHSLSQHYDVSPEAYWTESYFEIKPDYFKQSIETFSRLYGRPIAGCSALDVGAGIGKVMVALQRAGFDTYGFEPSPSFRDAAISRMGISEDRLKLASIEDAQWPDNTFDFIVFSAVLEHLVDPSAALFKLVGWLKPGGIIYVEVPSSNFLPSHLVRVFYRLTLSGCFVINTCPMHTPYHLYEFGTESFLKHGRGVYEVALQEYYPCASYMPKFLVGAFDRLMKWTDTGMQLAVWLRKLES